MNTLQDIITVNVIYELHEMVKEGCFSDLDAYTKITEYISLSTEQLGVTQDEILNMDKSSIKSLVKEYLVKNDDFDTEFCIYRYIIKSCDLTINTSVFLKSLIEKFIELENRIKKLEDRT